MLKNNTNLLVSIALCVYNGERFLKEQLDSLVYQTYSPIEIVVVDDCSTDSSLQIVEEYAGRFKNIKIFKNDRNLGYVKNFEKAMTLCTGELIALCDQDDVWDLNKISLQVALIGDNQLIYHDSRFIDELGRDMNKKMSDVLHLYRGDQPEVFLLINSVSGHSILFKRALLAEILPLHPDFFHDHWIGYVATNLGSIDFIPQCLVGYRQHTTASTDILNSRKKLDKTYHENRDVTKLKRELRWLKYCQSYKNNKDQVFVDQFVNLFEQRITSFFSFKYAALVGKHFDTLYHNKKLHKSSKKGFIYRQIWGLKAKTIWADIFARKS
ncbi:MAG TPA: glycosyltransferase [Dyadobacter sp.]|jgi:glycosyltransferase involved in cell wall biosynthesis|nr:glycosyltransferase [Dyadobacter sp.]